jgi:hypothetical protein
MARSASRSRIAYPSSSLFRRAIKKAAIAFRNKRDRPCVVPAKAFLAAHNVRLQQDARPSRLSADEHPAGGRPLFRHQGGVVNMPAVKQQYGQNFGVSVIPYRPPLPV